MTLKLSRADVLRPEAQTRVDWHYARMINELIGPLGLLHQRKAERASTGRKLGGPLIVNEADRQAILAAAARQDEAIAALDAERRRIKAGVRAAATAAEINAILANLETSQ
ncbi:hypothetical protein [Mesorhizobium sp.]|uniref:hypothetical protein n=1 Tax=Mesorhizobium sp. TaxID=1871066 RepID=UPI000FE8EC52|nr:hypothetical protein [Mesorhizobium sp.]RWC58933.1 MAG: hypothetical protein EOS56_18665 [Mesorhizobium sp.]RWC66545.1 MAG: hypothetical protein EOS29_04020 [Mesorhizobium sp.]